MWRSLVVEKNGCTRELRKLRGPISMSFQIQLEIINTIIIVSLE